MKKILMLFISLIAVIMVIVMYQQHQLINDYRSLLYSEMRKINVPIERILDFHQEVENYDEKERTEKLERLEENFADFFNYTGTGLQLEPKISEKYFITYNEAKLAYSHIIENYTAATTIEKREEAYKNLKEHYDRYNKFLKKSKEELVEPF